jgi:hypothetical protein
VGRAARGRRTVTTAPMTGLPRVDQSARASSMAIDCARCARRLSMAGRVWGQARHRGRLFRLWIRAAPLEPPPGAGDRAPGGSRAGHRPWPACGRHRGLPYGYRSFVSSSTVRPSSAYRYGSRRLRYCA